MATILVPGQVPKRATDGQPLASSSDLKPRSEGPVTPSQPLQVGDIVDTKDNRRAQVVAVSGQRATLLFEHLDHTGYGDGLITVDASGSTGSTGPL